jgi:hypothetical protein
VGTWQRRAQQMELEGKSHGMPMPNVRVPALQGGRHFLFFFEQDTGPQGPSSSFISISEQYSKDPKEK